MRISVVIPTYNEADNISKLIADLVRYLENSDFKDFEIIVVDDNSLDGTWKIVEEESKKDCRVKLIRRINVRGLGSAIVNGLRSSMGDYVIVMDADFQHPPSLVPKLAYKAIETEADVVVASRYARGGRVEGWSIIRRIISFGALLLAHLLIYESRRTRDPISGFFLVRKGLDFSALRGKGYKVLLEILVANPKAKVIDLPYTFTKRAGGKSKLRFRGIIDYIAQILWLSKFDRFAIVGASGVLVNLGAMALMFNLGASVDLASIFGIEISILWNYMWHETWTFKYQFKGGLKSILLRYVCYHLSVLVGAFMQYMVMKILYTLFLINPLLAQLAGIVVGLIANYIVSRWIVWP